jgi:hypothetical protein
MNATKALGIALAAAGASLLTTPAALAWPDCKHPGITGDTTSYETAVQWAIREHLILQHGLTRALQETQDDRKNSEAHSPDERIRSLEGLALPDQPRWRM